MTNENEMSVIGACFLDDYGLDTCLGMLKPYHFLNETYGRLFELMGTMAENNEAIDPVTVTTHDKSFRVIINDCVEYVPTTANIKYYAKNVITSYQTRRLKILATVITDNDDKNPSALIEMVDSELLKISGSEESKYSHIKKAAISAMKNMDKKGLLGIRTCWPKLDDQISGLCAGSLYCIAGRPGMGKTALATCITTNIARQGHPVAFFTLEMTKEEMFTRIMCAEARVNISRARNMESTQNDLKEWSGALQSVTQMPIYIDDNSSLTMAKLKANARAMKRKHGIKLLIVDYMQLMTGTGATRQQEIGSISRGLKVLAKDLMIPVIALSQLNRGLESRPDKRPMLSDLREAGDIEQDCDGVWMVYREGEYNDDADQTEGELILRKNRNGSKVIIRTKWIGQYCHYSEKY